VARRKPADGATKHRGVHRLLTCLGREKTPRLRVGSQRRLAARTEVSKEPAQMELWEVAA
jgi:hypothetical protein